MKEKNVSTIEVPARRENLEEALLFFQKNLDAKDISKEVVSETMLVIEAMFVNFLEQGIGGETTLRLSCRNSLGTILIEIAFEGRHVYLYKDEDGVFSPEDHILQAYEDKIDCNYHHGFNQFIINVKRKHLQSLLYCAAAVLLAVAVYFLIYLFLPSRMQLRLVAYCVVPVERILGNAALMIGAPVTFFSLTKNLMNTYILSNRYSEVSRLRLKATGTALIALLLAIGTGIPLLSRFREGPSESESFAIAAAAFSKNLSEIIPSSIFEPFEVISPIPLIVLSLIVTFAISSTGKYFVKLKEAVDICYAVFSKMLELVLFVFPFFFFASFLEILVYRESDVMLEIIQGVLLILAGTFTLAGFYLIRLKAGGVRIRPFLKKLPPMLLENCRINSSLDAVPFNIRYCVRHYRMDRKRLERSLPALAQIMLDGNCFLLMSVAIFLSFSLGAGVTLYKILVLAFMVVFLSLGAPNQPGSMLIGTIIILKYINADVSHLMFIPIFLEAMLGIFQNLINVIGDIVTVAVEEQRIHKNEQKLSYEMNREE